MATVGGVPTVVARLGGVAAACGQGLVRNRANAAPTETLSIHFRETSAQKAHVRLAAA